jgi:hypothetical protein
MVTLTWRPGVRAGIPRVSRARWWLYRIAVAVAVPFVVVAALYPPHFSRGTFLGSGGRIHQPVSFNPSWPFFMRIDLALTGIIVGFVIAFIGARIDHLIVESRRARGIDLLPSS